MSSITVSVNDGATQSVKDALALLGARAYAVVAVAIHEAMRDHFVERERIPNSKGWKKTHFFARARQQTHYSYTSSSASVHVSLVGFATHVLGKPDVIRPVRAKLLTIPAIAEAYGRRAREFDDLVFRIVENERGVMQPALVRAEQTRFKFGRQRKDGTRKATGIKSVGGEVYFWLAKAVHPKPHPQAIPSTETLQNAVAREISAFLETV